MTQTEIIQQIRDTKLGDNVLLSLRFALKAIKDATADRFIPDEPPYPCRIYVYYDDIKIRDIVHVINYIPSPVKVVIDSDGIGYSLYHTGQSKAKVNERLAALKVVGVKFCADGKVKFTK